MRFYTHDSSGRLVDAGTLGDGDRNPMWERAQQEAAKLKLAQGRGEIIDTTLLTAYEEEPEYLVPAAATTVTPPDVPAGSFARWMGASWVVEAEPTPEPVQAAPEPTQAAAAPAPAAPPVDPAVEALQAAEAQVQEHMDAMARGARYKSLDEVVTYAGEAAVPAYQQDGQKFRRWRSLMRAWFYSDAIQAKVRDGTFAAINLNTEAPQLNAPAAAPSPAASPAAAPTPAAAPAASPAAAPAATPAPSPAPTAAPASQ